MVRSNYYYTLCLLRPDGTALGESPVEVDWEPAAECCRFLGIRQGKLSAGGVATQALIEPMWHPSSGQPCVSAVHVLVSQEDGRQARFELPSSYFASLARSASVELVQRGLLRDGDFFRYLVGAYAGAPGGPGPEGARGLAVQEVCPTLPLRQSSLAQFTRRSVRYAPADLSGDLPVFVPQEVLDETAFLSRKAGALETGGILIGHVHQDSSLPELFVEVTAQVPARHSRSELMRLTFTADTWSAVAASVKLRKKDEIMLGWWHSHSYLKQDVAGKPQGDGERKPPKSAERGDMAFLSADDLSLHRTCFPRAYSLALVVAEGRSTGLTWALFGWNAGQICPRGFAVLPGAGWLANEPATIVAETGVRTHAQ
jgi:proteasome lid subunit RPN8/RPN11